MKNQPNIDFKPGTIAEDVLKVPAENSLLHCSVEKICRSWKLRRTETFSGIGSWWFVLFEQTILLVQLIAYNPFHVH